MTLCTSVYVLDDVDPHETFAFCRELLGADERHPCFDDPPDPRWGDPRHTLGNELGMGLDALLYLRYMPGAAIQAGHGCDNTCPADCTGRWHKPPHWLDVSFDTAYGFANDQGWSCGALHASLVTRLGMWLDERGARWAWRNEFTGDIHVGDRYERLFDLFKDSEQATRWFEQIVTPALLTHGLVVR